MGPLLLWLEGLFKAIASIEWIAKAIRKKPIEKVNDAYQEIDENQAHADETGRPKND